MCSTVVSHQPRLQRLEQPVDKHFSNISLPLLDISPLHINQSLHYYDQDVENQLNRPPESDHSGIRQQFLSNGFIYYPEQSETSRFPLQTPQYGSSLDRPIIRPRTPPVHLFTQHGLPLSLPPPPRTTFVAEPPVSNNNNEQAALVSFLDKLLSGSYLNMLSNQNDASVPGAGNAPAVENTPEGKYRSLRKQAKEQMLNSLTVPFDLDSFDDDLQENPHDAFLTSPYFELSPDTPFLATPRDDSFSYSLFEDDSLSSDAMPPPFGAIMSYPKEAACATGSTDTALPSNYESFDYSPYVTSPLMEKIEQFTPAIPSLDEAQFTIPESPALAPSDLFMPSTIAPPPTPVIAPPSASPSRPTKPLPTGTRRGVTAASLVPIDAPTQTRRYITPSTTSRKVIPAAFKGKKRQRSEMTEGGDEDGDVTLDDGTMEAIEAKRRQNTQAARRSRQRKLEYTRELEETVVSLTEERNMWQSRAYEAENKLRLHGIP